MIYTRRSFGLPYPEHKISGPSAANRMESLSLMGSSHHRNSGSVSFCPSLLRFSQIKSPGLLGRTDKTFFLFYHNPTISYTFFFNLVPLFPVFPAVKKNIRLLFFIYNLLLHLPVLHSPMCRMLPLLISSPKEAEQPCMKLISCIIIRKIGTVRLIGNLIFFQVFQDFLFFQAENRADDAAAYRLHGTKSFRPVPLHRL